MAMGNTEAAVETDACNDDPTTVTDKLKIHLNFQKCSRNETGDALETSLWLNIIYD